MDYPCYFYTNRRRVLTARITYRATLENTLPTTNRQASPGYFLVLYCTHSHNILDSVNNQGQAVLPLPHHG